MKRAAMIGLMLACATWMSAQTNTKPSTPSQSSAPAGAQANAAPQGKRPPQAKTQPEYDAYKNAAALTDAALPEGGRLRQDDGDRPQGPGSRR